MDEEGWKFGCLRRDSLKGPMNPRRKRKVYLIKSKIYNKTKIKLLDVPSMSEVVFEVSEFAKKKLRY